MEVNEDEPEDVRKATPVAGAIKSGAKDEEAGGPKATGKKKDVAKSSRCDKKAKKPTPVKSEADCCRSKISRERSKGPETMSVLVYSPPCTLPRLEIIPRHCLSKQAYIDVLAAPSRKCPSPCLGKTVVRKVRPISARMNELARPGRRLIVSTLQERGATLPPEMIENLVKSIEGSACMTPEQAERYFRDKERGKEKKSRKTARRQKCGGGSKKGQCPSQLDKEAVMCQYLMAERFVRSIIQWKCPIPVEEFADIASVILRRLSFVLEYEPTDGQDLKSQQMRFLADIVACWISGVLFEVAEEHKKEIEEEIKTQAEAEEEEAEEDEDEEDRKEEPKEQMQEPEEDDEDEVGKVPAQEPEGKEAVEDKKEKVKTQETGTQTEELPKEDKAQETEVVVKSEPLDPQEVGGMKDSAQIEAEKRKLDQTEAEKRTKREVEEKAKLEAEKALEEEKRRKEAEKEEELKRKEVEEKKLKDQKKAEEEEEARTKQKQLEEEEEAKKLKEAEDEKKREIEAEENRKKESEIKKKKLEDAKLKHKGPKDAIAEIGEEDLFATDIPFVNFGKIIDTIYKMLEDEPEGDETDPMHNRIQRALYEKFVELIDLESPDTLTENLKDVVDVLSGKIATWIVRLVSDPELKFLQSHPPEVQSREIRDWGKWIDQVADRAGDWADWIHRVVKEAEDHRDKSASINRGDWQNWTSDTETNALLWRRYYLETVHQAHHNKMMLVDRTVVKTGEKHFYTTTEKEIKNTDLGNDDE